MPNIPPGDDRSAAPLPVSFLGYLRSIGPGIIIVLTWLGAGDVVGAGVAGGNYGYALMWVMGLALIARYFFVSQIATYHLCNPQGESVIEGLGRLHSWYYPLIAASSFALGHVYGAFMLVGMGETSAKIAGWGETWQWALLWSGVTMALVFRPLYARIEWAFKALLAVLALALLVTALRVGFRPLGVLRGVCLFEIPADRGVFSSLLIAISMIGAVGGSLMNLVYPFLLDEKGWRGPRYLRLQRYDLLLAIGVMLVLNLAVWTVGAELVHQRGESIEDLDGLSLLLERGLGEWGRRTFLLGVFAAVFTSIIGVSLGLASLATHSLSCWRAAKPRPLEQRNSPAYRLCVIWILVSPLVWTLPHMPDFVTLTLIGNALHVLVMPALALGVWWITAAESFIGAKHRNGPLQNVGMLFVFALTLWATVLSVKALAAELGKLLS